MRKVFVVAVVSVIVLAFVAALAVPPPAGSCPDKGKGKYPVCDGPPPECPPCMEWDGCKCECRKIPGCKYNILEPPDPFPGE